MRTIKRYLPSPALLRRIIRALFREFSNIVPPQDGSLTFIRSKLHFAGGAAKNAYDDLAPTELTKVADAPERINATDD